MDFQLSTNTIEIFANQKIVSYPITLQVISVKILPITKTGIQNNELELSDGLKSIDAFITSADNLKAYDVIKIGSTTYSETKGGRRVTWFRSCEVLGNPKYKIGTLATGVIPATRVHTPSPLGLHNSQVPSTSSGSGGAGPSPKHFQFKRPGPARIYDVSSSPSPSPSPQQTHSSNPPPPLPASNNLTNTSAPVVPSNPSPARPTTSTVVPTSLIDCRATTFPIRDVLVHTYLCTLRLKLEKHMDSSSPKIVVKSVM